MITEDSLLSIFGTSLSEVDSRMSRAMFISMPELSLTARPKLQPAILPARDF